MINTLQLPPIPTSIIGISNIAVKHVELTSSNEFIITVQSAVKEIRCTKCNAITSPHGHGKTLTLRHLPIFGNETYIKIDPARGICRNCDGSPTSTQQSNWYDGGSITPALNC